MKPSDTIGLKLERLRGRRLTEMQVQKLLALAITLNRYTQQPWYKKIKRF